MPEPYAVTERKGSMITAKSGDADYAELIILQADTERHFKSTR